MPLRRAFGLPRPEEPTSPPFIRVQLSFDEMTEVELVIGRQACDCARVLPVATSNIGTVGQGTIVSGALAEAVQPFRTIRLSTGPFADNGPFVAA